MLYIMNTTSKTNYFAYCIEMLAGILNFEKAYQEKHSLFY